MESVRPVVRFAPSPDGYLHLGHAFSALLNYQFAMEQGGRFLLRIEDIDTGRSRPEFEQAIYEDLDWLGIKWEQPVRRQSEHFGDYRAASRHIGSLGLLYPCAASRKEILSYIAALPNAGGWPHDPDGGLVYPGIYRGRPITGEKMQDGRHALRLNMDRALQLLEERQVLPLTGKYFVECREQGKGEATGKAVADPKRWGDIILVRKDVPSSYHLSVVVDDALQGITHVIRGKDLEQATSIHHLLQVLLGLDVPSYCHHDLVKTEGGQKLSKSAGDISLRDLRKQGWTADDVKAHLFGGMS